MSQINIAGDTSGSIAIAAPAVAGSNTLTLPASTGTVLTSVSPASDLPSSIKGPAFSASKSGNQTGISNATFTLVTGWSEDFDTNNNFSSYRFTPTVAGYYQVNFSIDIGQGSVVAALGQVSKNGTTAYYTSGPVSGASAGEWYVSGSWLIYMNGSTDFLDPYVYISSASNIVYGGSTRFSASMVRSA